MDHPAAVYASNRSPQLLAAMVAAALTTVPRQEGVLRGSAASVEAAAEAAATSAMASAAERGASSSMPGTVIQQIAVQAGKSAATAIESQLATAVCPARKVPEEAPGANHYFDYDTNDEFMPIRFSGEGPPYKDLHTWSYSGSTRRETKSIPQAAWILKSKIS
jgi:hypothetical protein